MKSFVTCCLILLFVSCDSSEKKNTEVSSEKKGATETPKEEKSIALKDDFSLPQQGDYSSLFNLKKGDCSFITVSDIATAIGIQESSIKDNSKNGYCTYEITLADNSKWSPAFQWHSFSKNEITMEIKNYTEEGSPLTAQISKTKDTYLCIHPFNKWLMLYNNNYNGAIQISYCQALERRKLNKEQIQTREHLALKLGEFLLEKNQK